MTEGKRQRGRDRGEETEGKRQREEKEEKRQRGRDRDVSQRERDIREDTEGKGQRGRDRGERRWKRERVESYRRRDVLEVDLKRQRGTDRDEETERGGTGDRQRGTDRDEETERRGTGEQTERRDIGVSPSTNSAGEYWFRIYPFYVYDAALCWQSCAGSPLLAFLFVSLYLQSRSSCPILAVPFKLSCSSCLTCLSFSGCLLLPVLP